MVPALANKPNPLLSPLPLKVRDPLPDIVISPLHVHAPLKVTAPLPLLVIFPVPLMTPVMLVVPVDATVMVSEPIATAPSDNVPPVMVVTVGLVVEKVMAGLIVIVLVALSVSAVAPPLRVNALPPMTNAPEPALMVMDAKLVAEKSLLGVNRVSPAKTRASPATGAVPPQFAALVQRSSPPPPFHVRVAADEVNANNPQQMSVVKILFFKRLTPW